MCVSRSYKQQVAKCQQSAIKEQQNAEHHEKGRKREQKQANFCINFSAKWRFG